MKIKSKRVISIFLIIATLFGNVSSLNAMAVTKSRDPYSVIDNNNPVNNGYDFLMESDEPLKIRKRLLGDNISISNMVGTYGTLQDNGDYFIYNLSDFLNGIEEFDISVDGKDEVLRIIPTPEMVYDDDFIGIEYPEGFEVKYNENHYGNSAHYIAKPPKNANVEFDFCGEGISMDGVSSKSTSLVTTRLSLKDAEGNTLEIIKNNIIDTVLEEDYIEYRKRIIYYNSAGYKSNLSFKIIANKNSVIYVDSFTIYNPLSVNDIDESIDGLYARFNNSKKDVIDIYIDNTHIYNADNIVEYKIFEKWLLMYPNHEEATADNINGRIVFETLEGKYGNLTYDDTDYGTVNTLYRYKLNGWLAGIDEFKVTIDGVPKVLRLIPLNHLDFVRENVSSNLDIYIKSENLLSMSLNTDVVSFENYSGVAPQEKLGAVNITINSSLPYDLSAYMPTEISNADGSKKIGFDIFNIKESSESVYQKFIDTTNKVILKSDCIKGNGKVHSIDLKLESNNAHKADVYRTVIKFEAQQK